MKDNLPIKVAIADDYDIFKQGIEMVLKSFPEMCLMIKASNGLDLLEQIKKNKPDLVLLDLRMPVMDGLSTLPELKRLYNNIKVIILSMKADYSDVQQAFRKGADDYLLKSSDPKAIYKAILRCCDPNVFYEHSMVRESGILSL